MSEEIEFKLELLKLEKEHQEKLEKEGYKQITIGKGYTVLSKEEKPLQSVSSFNNPKNVFNLDQAQTANTNFAIDRHIKMKVPPDPLVFIKMPRSKLVWAWVKISTGSSTTSLIGSFTPCAAYMRYIKSYPVVGTVEQTMEKKKGFTSRFNASTEIKASASAGFFGCEASLEVTTGFEYEETVTSETTHTWKQTLTEGTYIVYQNVLVYAYTIVLSLNQTNTINQYNPGMNLRYIQQIDRAVMFVPINRDDPFTLRYQDATWDPVEYDSLINYLVANPSKWRSDS
ncbi:hypothetical protein DDB_G0282815 [Dictyostelium discoideum AX4]|uniref:Monalysin Pore-forming domain-containing protein n=1 Tax=Dictyostelium discoideum TaxID=44689 RepID=Q54RZ4_DICDI|nr:hypothetical protein DDB_G0282815 [Dictyostelium discoideum AX4]EAL65987.1 hypothetical protein DDB_G0282815 [Dictyostelium discoideum AX4]|eukprot:XP_639343.1 hypothetical protein DDB_G0282815 [Dictyostelium discoideum AX4]